MSNYSSPYRWDIYNKYKSIEKSGRLPDYKYLKNNISENSRYETSVSLSNISISFKLDQRILTFALTYLDIYLQRTNEKESKNISLIAVSCLSLASKIHGIDLDFEELTKHLNDETELSNIIDQEIKTFNLLNNNLLIPNEYLFIELYYEIFSSDYNFIWDSEMDTWIKYIGLLISTSGVRTFHPSIMSLSAIYLTEVLLYNNNFMEDHYLFFGYNEEEIKYVAQFIYDEILINNEELISKYINKLISGFNNLNYDIVSENHFFDEKIILDNDDNIKVVKHKYIPSEIISTELVQKDTKLGTGGYGEVFSTQDKVAFKNMFCELDNGIEESILKEISILRYSSHPNLLDLGQVTFDLNSSCYGVLFELMEGDLMSKINQARVEKYKTGKQTYFTEYKIKRFSSQILQGLEYLHSNGIIHHDIKPQNVLVKGNDIKLADYGLSEIMISRRIFLEPEFTLIILFTPPEVVLYTDNYWNPEIPFGMGYEVDIWAAGLTIAMMSSLQYIVGANDERMIHEFMSIYSLRKFKKELGYLLVFNFDTRPFRFYRKGMNKEDLMFFMEIKDDNHYNFVMSMLQLDPRKRVTARQALNDPFLVM